MSRPQYVNLQSTQSSWDALVNDNYDVLRTSIPLPEYANFAALPPANQNDGCVAVVQSPSWIPYFSDGANWIELPTVQSVQTDQFIIAGRIFN